MKNPPDLLMKIVCLAVPFTITIFQGIAIAVPCNDNEVVASYDKSDSRYHSYAVPRAGQAPKVVCNTSNVKCTKSLVFTTMLSSSQYIAPTDDVSVVKNCKVTKVNIPIPFSAPDEVVTTVESSNFKITNYTKKSHVLHPGTVVRQVVEKNGVIFIQTSGEGTGILKTINEWASGTVWRGVDDDLIKAVKKKL